MANSTTHASLPYPIRKARYTLEYVGLDADGDPTDPTTPDTELSLDGASFADATEEISTITGSNGCGYITLTGAEMDTALTMACVKVASGPKATVFSLRPRNLAIVDSGTLSAGSAGGGTLGTLLAYDVTGCFIRTTGGTGGGGTGGANNQARRIITYNTSTGAFTVSPNWETTPSTDTTYDVLLPEGVTLGMLKTLNPTTAGATLDVSATGEAGLDWGNIGSKTTTNALTGTTIATTQKVDIETVKTQAVTCSAGITVNTNVGTTQPLNFTGTAGSALVKSDTTHIAGTAWASTTLFTLASHDPGATIGTSTLTQAQVTGGAYALNSASFSFNTAFDFTTTQKAATLARVTLVDTTTTLTNAPSDSSGVTTLLSRVPSGIFTGITSLAQWLGLIAGKQTGNSTARTEIRATGAGSGTFDETTDSVEALRDRGDAAWITATSVTVSDKTGFRLSATGVDDIWDEDISGHQTSGTAGYAANAVLDIYANGWDGVNGVIKANSQYISGVAGQVSIRNAVGLSSANLDTQLTAIDDFIDTEVAAIYSRIGAPAGASIAADIAAIAADSPNTPTKNVAFSNLVFTMVDATDFNTPETGVTVTAQISKDGGSFANCTNSVSEISGGFYKISLTQTEMNCDAVALKFTGTGCAQRNFSFRTQPT